MKALCCALLMVIGLPRANACHPRDYVAHQEVDDYAFVVRGFVESASAYKGSDGISKVEVRIVDPIFVRGSGASTFWTPLYSAACGAEVVVGRYVWIFADKSRQFQSADPYGLSGSPEMRVMDKTIMEEIANSKGFDLRHNAAGNDNE